MADLEQDLPTIEYVEMHLHLVLLEPFNLPDQRCWHPVALVEQSSELLVERRELRTTVAEGIVSESLLLNLVNPPGNSGARLPGTLLNSRDQLELPPGG